MISDSTAAWRLLVIDDDDLVLQSLRMTLPDQWSMAGISQLSELPDENFVAAIVDMHLSGDITRADGLEAIQSLTQTHPHLEIVAMSGILDRETMEACLKAGASRFLAKPLNPEELSFTLDKIEALLLLRAAQERQSHPSTQNWVGQSQASQQIHRQLANLRNEEGPILIEGESGTGKEVAAHILHQQEIEACKNATPRPFIMLNAASFPDNLFESEFFGHVKGAFTGAQQNKMGLAEAAHGGDLFIDEIEALPLNQQAKLLRFLESGEVRRIGAQEVTHVKTRVIAASNRSLKDMVEKEEFREDLLWRISGKRIELPPLRERKEDVSALVEHFLELERPRRSKTLAADALEALQAYGWPGNVRELKRVCEQLCLLAPLPFIRAEDVYQVIGPIKTPSHSKEHQSVDYEKGLNHLLGQYEAELISQCMMTIKDVDAVAKTLKISRSSLYKKIKDYDIRH